MKPYRSYQKAHLEALKNSKEAAAYLNAALEEGDSKLFLVALKDVLEARGGMAFFSAKTKLNRVSLYKMLSRKGNPEWGSLVLLLNALGIQFQIARRRMASSHSKAA